jgi:predicted dehydrogenase
MSVRIAVVGVGYLGQHHARLLASMDGVRLTAIVDTKPGRAEEVASKYGVAGFTHLRDLDLEGDELTVVDRAAVYVWHSDREESYSLYSPGVKRETVLRGVQKT